MPPIEDACPFEPDARAERCETCCDRSELTPCAIAWLRHRIQPSNVVPLLARTERSRAA